MTPSVVEPKVRKHYKKLLSEIKVVERYECPLCHQLERNEYGITNHLLGHAIDDRIAELWEMGKTLKEIHALYHMFQGIIRDMPESDNNFLKLHWDITKARRRGEMKTTKELEIPEGKFCNKCPCFLEQVDSYNYEESHNWCFYLGVNLNKEIPLIGKKTKKPKECPAYPVTP